METKTMKLYHNSPTVKTLEDFAKQNKIFLGGEKSKTGKEPLTIESFFELNRLEIFNQMTVSEKIAYIKEKGFKSETEKDEETGEFLQLKVEELTADKLDKDMTLPCPCYLLIDTAYVPYSLGIKRTNFQEPAESVTAFEDEQISNILNDENFIEIYGAKKVVAGCRVFGFFKTLYYKSGKGGGNANNIYDRKNLLTDLTPYIISINTSVSVGGGQFTIMLPHIPLYTNDEEQVYKNSQNSKLTGFGSSGHGEVQISSITQQDLLTLAEKDVDEIIEKVLGDKQFDVFGMWNDPLYKDSEYYAKSTADSRDYFNWLIQKNDIFLISFDSMPNVGSERDIAGKSFDMIGLVDSVSLSRDPSGNITVRISGRDLMKLINDDSTLFFPQSVANGDGNIFENTESSNSDKGDMGIVKSSDGRVLNNRQRMPISGNIKIFTMEAVNGYTIDFVLKAVISQLANMSVAPDELFNLWPEKRRTKFNDFSPVHKNKPEQQKK